jgi:hypothetical protein
MDCGFTGYDIVYFVGGYQGFGGTYCLRPEKGGDMFV